ncbi:hypothetical protein LSTR_LSTR017578 [Laodelphax striatellus]|uniref:Uncharacterized protein n=1 Tax=Laodelphax striatellus TaxID=195883 RepID=A0A482WJZ8_LAOST|nr:hypothetical protein LSTR_LSTR017578 [Laodelphax striatellus]
MPLVVLVEPQGRMERVVQRTPGDDESAKKLDQPGSGGTLPHRVVFRISALSQPPPPPSPANILHNVPIKTQQTETKLLVPCLPPQWTQRVVPVGAPVELELIVGGDKECGGQPTQRSTGWPAGQIANVLQLGTAGQK